MAAPNVRNRMRRGGRANPGREHLAGADVTRTMQRQYEHILQSLRERRRFGSDAKRKQVAAATVRKLAHNPSMLETWRRNLFMDDAGRAEALADDFHGRAPRDVIDVEETEEYDEHGAVLGYLVELGILTEDGESEIPIRFPYHPGSEDNVLVVSNSKGTNIEFIGGDQKIDWQSIDGASAANDKYLVLVGPVFEVVYWADKHHLSGPKEQKAGMEYFHEFGEDEDFESGDAYDALPWLVYDRRNQKMLLVGGSYTIEPEGITG